MAMSGHGVKWVASADLEAETIRWKNRRKDWTKLMNLAANLRKCSNTYLDTWGDMNAPEDDVIEDPCL